MLRNSHAKVSCESASPQQPFQEQNERYNQRHKRKRQQQRMNGTGTRAHHFSSAAKECTEQSPQPDQDKNGERAKQSKQRENPEKASRPDEAYRWIHGESPQNASADSAIV